MDFLDILLGIPLLWAIYKGFTKGFMVEVASLAGLILGIYFAIHFSNFSTDFLREVFGFNGRYLHFIAFVLTFLVVLGVMHLLGKVLEKMVEMVAMGYMNRIAGAVFSIAKTAFVLSILLFLLNSLDPYQKIIKPEKKQKSLLYTPVEKFAPWILPKLKPGGLSIPLPRKEKPANDSVSV